MVSNLKIGKRPFDISKNKKNKDMAEKYTLIQLKEKCKKKGLNVSGTKLELCKRLNSKLKN